MLLKLPFEPATLMEEKSSSGDRSERVRLQDITLPVSITDESHPDADRSTSRRSRGSIRVSQGRRFDESAAGGRADINVYCTTAEHMFRQAATFSKSGCQPLPIEVSALRSDWRNLRIALPCNWDTLDSDMPKASLISKRDSSS